MLFPVYSLTTGNFSILPKLGAETLAPAAMILTAYISFSVGQPYGWTVAVSPTLVSTRYRYREILSRLQKANLPYPLGRWT